PWWSPYLSRRWHRCLSREPLPGEHLPRPHENGGEPSGVRTRPRTGEVRSHCRGHHSRMAAVGDDARQLRHHREGLDARLAQRIPHRTATRIRDLRDASSARSFRRRAGLRPRPAPVQHDDAEHTRDGLPLRIQRSRRIATRFVGLRHRTRGRPCGGSSRFPLIAEASADSALARSALARAQDLASLKPSLSLQEEIAMSEDACDVVIIGAGPTGLSAARRLRRAGRSVIVLEARDRVGGRTWTDHIDGQMYELGGQWISPDQTALLDLVAELGKETYPRYRDGDSVYIAPDGTRTVYSGDLFPVGESTQAEMERLIGILDDLAARIGPKAPWDAPDAAELDSISFHHWLRQQSDDELACDNIGLFIAGGMLTNPATAFSALQAVLMAASAGSFTHLVDDHFILDRRVVGGMQSVSVQMADELGTDTVLLNQPVRRIDWSDEGVTVSTDELTVRAAEAIIAVPP